MKKGKQSNESLTLLQVYDQENEKFGMRVGIDRAESSYARLLQGRRYVEHFLRDQYGMDDIKLSGLQPFFIHDFSSWLCTMKHLRSGTVWLTCQQLKGVVTRAYHQGMLTANPFYQFRIAKNIRPREYLTEQELRIVLNYKFTDSRLAFTRDLFVFAAFTGLAYIDMKELTASQLVFINGEYWIVSRRHKTRVPFQVKLLNIPLSIMQRHAQDHYRTLFNMPSYRTLANQVKQVMARCGINKNITLHCARHTFAVMALNQGMPIESVSQILGHSNITTTQIYAKITWQKLDGDLTILSKKLDEKFVTMIENEEKKALGNQKTF